VKPAPQVQRLRRLALAQTFFPQTTLEGAFERLGFVQADPIRAPARAQDLILRHRVKGYHAGDLERRYHALGIEEDDLYAYGFLRRDLWALLHPPDARGLSELETRMLQVIRDIGPTHPSDLVANFGNERAVNAWGSMSRATTLALEDLQRRGFLRIAHRVKGVRVYEAVPASEAGWDQEAAMRRLVMAIMGLLAPLPTSTIGPAFWRFRRGLAANSYRRTIDALVRDGRLCRETVDGITYVYPADAEEGAVGDRVRFLAPFDPLVWDRKRFQHLWSWEYRFEAYTPAAKRVRGYYALPLLWRDDVIGWANLKLTDGTLNVELGYIEQAPTSKAYATALDAEVARFEAFIGTTSSQRR
jgi:uncharacterized protein YcaQ